MPLLALACLGDRQGPSPKCRALQLGNGRTGLGGVHHRDEGKAAGAAGLPLRHKVDVLHRSIRFEELAQLFEAYGAVEHVHLVTERETGRSRGFAFVTMVNAPEARAAIAELQGTTFGGRTLTVTEARQREERHGPRRPRG